MKTKLNRAERRALEGKKGRSTFSKARRHAFKQKISPSMTEKTPLDHGDSLRQNARGKSRGS